MSREDRPKAHLIEPAKSKRSTCQSCHKPIMMGQLRLSEAFVTDEGYWAKSHSYARSERPRGYDSDDRDHRPEAKPDVVARFHHLACAAQHQPYKLRSALAAAAIEIPDRAALEEAIERALSVGDVAEEDDANREVYQRFIADIRDAYEDEALLVFGDWLQSTGDPRGELIATQHGLEAATPEERVRLADLEKKLLATHRKRFLLDRLDGKIVWRRGFVHRLVVPTTALDKASLARAFAHPSFRLLREFAVEVESAWATPRLVAPNLPPLPATLRALELTAQQLGDIAALLDGSLPQLERLRLGGAASFVDLAHPTLAQLELDSADPKLAVASIVVGAPRALLDRLPELAARRLPRLRHLVLRVEHDLDLALAAVPVELLTQLHDLTLLGDASEQSVALLERRGLRFDAIDVRRCTRLAPRDLERLAQLADHLVRDEAPPAAEPAKIREWLVRHTRRPEWGTGKVIAEGDDGLEVAFEHGGTKHVRNVELLEEVQP